jgi:hypothetical protein
MAQKLLQFLRNSCYRHSRTMTSASPQRTLLLAAAVPLALAYALAVSGNARAADPLPGQQASTGQAAAASGSAAQEQPQNLVVSIRYDSPGANGPVVQTNTDTAIAGSSNGSATDQEGAPAGDQNAATGQDATAGASATQNAPQNVVIVIRVNSPGANGPIVQGNTAGAAASAANASETEQGAAPERAALRTAWLDPRPRARPVRQAAPVARAPHAHRAAARARPGSAPTEASSARAAPAAAKPHVTPPRHAASAATTRIAPAPLLNAPQSPPIEAVGSHEVSRPVLLALLSVLAAALLAAGARLARPWAWRHA